eukprot:11211878-Lingulodinium_polyedra.AAC.1
MPRHSLHGFGLLGELNLRVAERARDSVRAQLRARLEPNGGCPYGVPEGPLRAGGSARAGRRARRSCCVGIS